MLLVHQEEWPLPVPAVVSSFTFVVFSFVFYVLRTFPSNATKERSKEEQALKKAP